jgi:HK97 family phage portal protein
MALFARMFNQAGGWPADDDRWYAPFLGLETNAGAKVDYTTAMGIPAVWACTRIIAESIASLPLHLYIRKGRGKDRMPSHPLYPLLHDKPNPEMSAMSFRETFSYHILHWGNAFAEKEMDQLGRVKALWPIGPDRVEVMRDRDTREIFYKVRVEDTGKTQNLQKDQVLHIPGLSYNGVVGFSPITKMREAIGFALATEEYGARFFGAGTHPSLVVSHPSKLSPTAHKNLSDSLADKYSGLGKSHRLLLLEEAMKVEKIGFSPEDSQFLQTRAFELAEVCRIWRVPLHLVQEYSKGTSYASNEQQSLEFVIHTLRPWLVRFEQGYNNQLFATDLERRRYFFEHLVDGLLRGDITARYEAYTKGRNWGWLSADDIRELENMNPLPEGKGDVYLQPLNMVEAGTPPPPQAPPPAQSEPNSPEPQAIANYWKEKTSEMAIIEPYRGIFTDAIEQILSREANQLKRDPELFNKTLQASDVSEFIIKKMKSPVSLFLHQNGIYELESFDEEINNYFQYHISKIKNLLSGGNGAIDTLASHAEEMAEETLLAILGRLRSKENGLQTQ